MRRQTRRRGRVTETEVKREWMDGHSLNGERYGVVSNSVPSVIWVSLYHWDGSKLLLFLLHQWATKPACLLLQPSVHNTETGVSYCSFFSVDSSQAACSGHVAKAAFVMVVPSVIPQRSARRRESWKEVCFCFNWLLLPSPTITFLAYCWIVCFSGEIVRENERNCWTSYWRSWNHQTNRHVRTVQNSLENVLVDLKNREVCKIVSTIQNSRQRTLTYRKLETCQYASAREVKHREGTVKNNRWLDLSSSKIIDITPGHHAHTNTHSHWHSHRKRGAWVYDRLGRCSRELRQENSSELKRQESEKQDTWEEGKWRGKTRSSHVGISVGKTWSLKTTAAQGCSSVFVVLSSHHSRRVQFSSVRLLLLKHSVTRPRTRPVFRAAVSHTVQHLRCPHCASQRSPQQDSQTPGKCNEKLLIKRRVTYFSKIII